MGLETKITMFGNPSSEYFISDVELYRLLGDAVADDGVHWNFRRKGLQEFAQQLNKLYMVSNGGFTCQITKPGETTSMLTNLSFNEFMKYVTNNQLRTDTKYLVAGSQ